MKRLDLLTNGLSGLTALSFLIMLMIIFSPQSKVMFGPPLTYRVQNGDTLFAIAQTAVNCGAMQCGADLREALDDLENFNPGLSAIIQPGQVIHIPVTNPQHPSEREMVTQLKPRTP